MQGIEGDAGRRVPLFAANWKMNYTISDTRNYFEEFFKKSPSVEGRHVVFCPPFTSLQSARMLISGKKGVQLGAQNLFWKDAGAYTGECSGPMLKDLGVEFVIVGHSERREYFRETNSIVSRKLRAALSCDLMPILCVGEKEKTRRSGKTLQVVRRQLKEAIGPIPDEDASRVVVAYEPIWAIGTGLTASPEQAEEVHAMIRDTIAELHGTSLALTASILYGGSVNPDNIVSLMEMEDIDGALVGGASLDPVSFLRIIFNERREIFDEGE